MKHEIELFNPNGDGLANELIGEPEGFVLTVLFAAMVGGFAGGIFTNDGAVAALGAAVCAIVWIVLWGIIPRFHITHGLTRRQSELYDTFVTLPDEVRREMGGTGVFIDTVRAANKAELYEISRSMQELQRAWKDREAALAKVAPERDTVAGYLENVKQKTSDLRTEAQTYEEML